MCTGACAASTPPRPRRAKADHRLQNLAGRMFRDFKSAGPASNSDPSMLDWHLRRAHESIISCMSLLSIIKRTINPAGPARAVENIGNHGFHNGHAAARSSGRLFRRTLRSAPVESAHAPHEPNPAWQTHHWVAPHAVIDCRRPTAWFVWTQATASTGKAVGCGLRRG
jgi:hypothetical protein